MPGCHYTTGQLRPFANAIALYSLPAMNGRKRASVSSYGRSVRARNDDPDYVAEPPPVEGWVDFHRKQSESPRPPAAPQPARLLPAATHPGPNPCCSKVQTKVRRNGRGGWSKQEASIGSREFAASSCRGRATAAQRRQLSTPPPLCSSLAMQLISPNGRPIILQDDLLRRMVAQYGAKNWKKIGVQRRGGRRSGCRQEGNSCTGPSAKPIKPACHARRNQILPLPQSSSTASASASRQMRRGTPPSRQQWRRTHAKAAPFPCPPLHPPAAADHFADRSDVQCLHRWQKVLNPEVHKGPWTAEEDQKILRCAVRAVRCARWACFSAARYAAWVVLCPNPQPGRGVGWVGGVGVPACQPPSVS